MHIIKQEKYISAVFWATFLSWVGNWMTSLVIFQWVFQVSKSPALLGTSVMVHRLPLLFGSLVFSDLAGKMPGRLRSLFDVMRAILLSFMAIIVYLAQNPSADLNSLIFIFLTLAGIRSFLSGADGPSESAIVSAEAKNDRVRAAKNQQVMAMILGCSGFIASALFTIGALSFSLIAVLTFDLISFLISGLVFFNIRSYDRITKPEIKFYSPLKIFKNAMKYPFLIMLTSGHFLRMFGMSVCLQQWLLLFQVKLKMGTWSAGYLYMTFTLAWFVSAHLVRKLSWRPSLLLFLFCSLVICIAAPFAWYISSIPLLILFTFVITLIDGALLASIGGEIQLLVRDQHVPEAFGNLAIWTQIGVVSGAVLIGRVSELFGYENGSFFISILASSALIVLILINYLFEPILEWSWHYLRLRLNGLIPIQTFVSFSSIEEFLDLKTKTQSNIGIVEGSSVLKIGDRTVYSGSVIIDLKNDPSLEWTALNLAMFETLERIGSVQYFENKSEIPPLPSTSGIAVQKSFILAEKAARFEAIERDAILAHYYFKVPPVSQIDRDSIIRDCKNEKLTACEVFEKCNFFKFQTSDPSLYAWMCKIEIGRNFSLGWGISESNAKSGIEKALSEAISSFRFHQIQKLDRLREHAAAGKFNIATLEAFNELVTIYNVNATDVQMALVLSQPDSLERINYLNCAPLSASLQNFLVPIKEPSWIPKLELQTENIENEILGDLVLCRASSKYAFTIRWPKESTQVLEEIHIKRFDDSCHTKMSKNINCSNLYY